MLNHPYQKIITFAGSSAIIRLRQNGYVKEIFTKKVLIFGVILALLLCLLTYFMQAVIFPQFANTSSEKARTVITPADLSSLEQTQQEIEMPTPTVQLLPAWFH